MKVAFLAFAIAALAHAQGYIGLMLNDARPGPGAVVMKVAPGGPADSAGLKEGDVVTAIDNTPVQSANAMTERVISTPAGTTIRVTFLRGSQRRTISIAVDTRDGKTATFAKPAIPPAALQGAAIFDTKGAPPSGVTFATIADPQEHAFTVEVPSGWKSEAGLARLGALAINPYVRSLSPDKMTYLLFGEPTMPTFGPPTELGRKLGFKEGNVYSPGFGQRTMIMRYMPGMEFARNYGSMAIANVCPDTKLVSTNDRPDIAQQTEALLRPVIPTRYDAGEATFSCVHNKQEMQASVLVVTWTTKDSVMWVVQTFLAFIAPKTQAPQAAALAMHIILSTKFDPAWTQKQNQLSQQAAQAINQRVAQQERQQAAFIQKLNAVDENFEQMDELISGYSHYHDAATGQDYMLSNANPYKWIDDSGRIVSTPTNIKPPWGYTFRAMPRKSQ